MRRKNEWIIALVEEIVDTPHSLTLIPKILAVLARVSREPNFIVPRTPHNSEEISFTTQENMYPQRVLLRDEWTLSPPYSVLLEFIHPIDFDTLRSRLTQGGVWERGG